MIEEIVWNDQFLIGIEEIDVQHKHLCKMVNQCLKKANGKLPNIANNILFDKLRKYVVWHFNCEESIMQIMNYEKYQVHKEEHEELLAMLDEQIELVYQNSVNMYSLAEFMYGWFGGHSFGYDKELGVFLKKVWI